MRSDRKAILSISPNWDWLYRVTYNSSGWGVAPLVKWKVVNSIQQPPIIAAPVLFAFDIVSPATAGDSWYRNTLRFTQFLMRLHEDGIREHLVKDLAARIKTSGVYRAPVEPNIGYIPELVDRTWWQLKLAAPGAPVTKGDTTLDLFARSPAGKQEGSGVGIIDRVLGRDKSQWLAYSAISLPEHAGDSATLCIGSRQNDADFKSRITRIEANHPIDDADVTFDATLAREIFDATTGMKLDGN